MEIAHVEIPTSVPLTMVLKCGKVGAGSIASNFREKHCTCGPNISPK
jgi:hypothetical protein